MKTEQSQIHAFLSDLTEICRKHNVQEIYTRIEKGERPTTLIYFTNGSVFEDLEFSRDDPGATVWLPEAERLIGR